MLRREFLAYSAASAGIVGIPPIKTGHCLDRLLSDIEAAILAELPGVKKIQISFDPEDKNVPLMILAFRI